MAKKRKKKKPYKKPERPAFIAEQSLTVINDDKDERRTKAKNAILQKDTIEYQEEIKHILELIKDGLAPGEIYATLLISDHELTDSAFNVMMRDAVTMAELAIYKDREYTFQLHMDRYEKMYHEAMKLEYDNGMPIDPIKGKAFMISRLIDATAQLQAKEKLIGLHDKSLTLELTQTQTTVVEKEETRGSIIPGYDIEQLKLEDQIELLSLIKEARTVPIEGIQRVVIKKTVIEINQGERSEYQKVETKDIEFEEMPDDVVSKFEKLPDKKKDEEPDMGTVAIEDLTGGQKGKSVDEIREIMQNNALDELKKKIKSKKL